MSQRAVKVLPLECPSCRKALEGLRYDAVFTCLDCGLAAVPGGGTSPLLFAAPDVPSSQPVLYLPVWHLAVELRVRKATRQHLAVLREQQLEGQRSVWVPGFAASRTAYFGDLGLALTERRYAPTPFAAPPQGAQVVGICRDPEAAGRYALLYLLAIIDKRADVTGLELEVPITGATLYGVPFADEGTRVIDMALGTSVPCFAIDDLEDIRRLVARGPLKSLA